MFIKNVPDMGRGSGQNDPDMRLGIGLTCPGYGTGVLNYPGCGTGVY